MRVSWECLLPRATLPRWGAAVMRPNVQQSGGEPLLEKLGRFGAFDAAADGVHDAATENAIAVEGEPIGNVQFSGLRNDLEVEVAHFEKSLLKNGAQDFFAKQILRALEFQGRLEAVSRLDGDELVACGNVREDEEVEGTVDGVHGEETGVRGFAHVVFHAVKGIRNIGFSDAPQRATAHAPIKGGKPGGGKCAQGFLLGDVGLESEDGTGVH